MPLKNKQVIFVVGPTAIGKTRLAVKLAGRINGEIISADSMQAYKGMDVLSQAPAPAQTKKIRHHLIKFLSPGKEYSAAVFRRKASLAIEDIFRRRKVPIVSGGSGLYVKALVDGLFPSPKADPAFRAKMYKYASRYGNKRLHEKLKKVDEEAALSIHPNDVKRVIRALEIWHTSGKTMTRLKKETKGLKDKCRVSLFGLTARRQKIYDNINKRTDRMLCHGAIGEVRRLSGRTLSKTAKAALGFKEIAGYLAGEYDYDTAVELMKRNTRRFAKRQLTWFRADKRIAWFDTASLDEKKIIRGIMKAVARG